MKKILIALLLCLLPVVAYSAVELDYMEYASDGAAQAAYVTNATTYTAFISQVNHNNDLFVGNDSNRVAVHAQSFTLTATTTIKGLSVYFTANAGSPEGNIRVRIETDSAGSPSGTLADANATLDFVPTPSAWNDVLYTAFSLSSGSYWIVISSVSAQSNNVGWLIYKQGSDPYAGGVHLYKFDAGAWAADTGYDLTFKVYNTALVLQAYSESTIKTHGSYSLKGVAAATASLNKTLTRTVSPTINLSGMASWKLDIEATRTGSNIKIGVHDSGGTTTEVTPNITGANYQTIATDISGVSDANKDAIDGIIITPTNADADNTFYIDNMFGETVSAPSGQVIQLD